MLDIFFNVFCSLLFFISNALLKGTFYDTEVHKD